MEVLKSEFACCLCQIQSDAPDGFKNVETTKALKSDRLLRSIIQHLLKQAHSDLTFAKDALVCLKCYADLSDYDSLMLKLVDIQDYFKGLFHQLPRTITIYNPEDLIEKVDDWSEHSVDHSIVVGEEEEFIDEPNSTEKLYESKAGRGKKEVGARDPPKISNDDIIKEFDIKSDIDAGSGSDLEDCVEEMLDEINKEPITLSDIESDIENSTLVVETMLNEQEMDDGQVSKLLDWNILRPRHKCPYCRNKYKLLSNLDDHIEKEHQFGKICKMCGVAVKDEEYLELHMNVHRGKTEYDCCYCPKRYSSKLCVIRHMQKHWDKKKFQCEKCGLRFSETSLLYNHRLQHEAEENPLICEFCNQSFKTKRTYKNHLKTHNEHRVRYRCPYCEKTFVEKYTANKHLKKMHMQEAQVLTDISDSRFEPSFEADSNDYDDQEFENVEVVDYHHVVDEGEAIEYVSVVYDCMLCSKSFPNQEIYNEHLQEQHGMDVND